MDPMAQAFAFYTFDDVQGRLVYTAGAVQPKYFNNDTTLRAGLRDARRPAGKTAGATGTNALLGWDDALPGSGSGAKSLGEEFGAAMRSRPARSRKSSATVCLRSPQDEPDRDQIESMMSSFRSSGYRLKQAFSDAATYCMGD